MSDAPTKAVIYARFSPQPKAKMLAKETACAIDDQFRVCREFCARHELEVIAEHSDAGKSRSDDYDRRPGLWESVRLARKGVAIVAYRRDRLGSGPMMILIEHDIRKRGGRILAVEGSQNDESHEGALINSILACVAEYERQLTAARTKAMLRAKQANGVRVCRKGRLPYGMMLDPDDPARMVPCQDEQEVIARALELTAEGYSARVVADKLFDEGFRSRRPGGRFQHSLVLAIRARSGVEAERGVE